MYITHRGRENVMENVIDAFAGSVCGGNVLYEDRVICRV